MLTVLLASCDQSKNPPDPAGIWRATLTLPGGELPFGLEFEKQADGSLQALMINGEERAPANDVKLQADKLTIAMPGYQNRLEAMLSGDSMSGEVVMIRRGGEQQRIPLRAARNQTFRFFQSPMQSDMRAAGRWAVQFKGSNSAYPAVGEFQQNGAKVTGTFLTETGDHRFLAGEIRGQELYLSGFDGGHAFLYRATFIGADRIEGSFWSGLHSLETFVAERNDAETLADASRITQLRHSDAKLDFSFPDIDGKTVALRDDAYRGKVVIVTLAGSWCPNCHDEAAYLAPLYRKLKSQGLEVIALMFERYGDFAQAAAATRVFKDEFGIDYATLIAGVSDKDDAAGKLPQLNGVFAFPTTIFIGRDGRVRHIHTGFSGPATGEHYRELTNEFETRLSNLLAEPVS